jgi:uncharacterized protein (DUF433 family)
LSTPLEVFPRITISPKQMGGHQAFEVATVAGMAAEGMTEAEILGDVPYLEPEDIKEALKYAAETLRLGEWAMDENCQDHRNSKSNA